MKDKMKTLRPFETSSYDAIQLDRLVIFTTVALEKHGIELSLENIIVGAFKLFPKKFSLVGYPEFPDATRVEKCLWRCKGNKRQWIGGKTRHGYLVTERTRLVAAQTGHQLSTPALGKQKVSPRRRRKESILKEVTDSPVYLKYLRGEKASISEADFCFLVQGTLDSSRETLSKNFLALKMTAQELESEELSNFLGWLEHRFKKFLFAKRK